MIGDQGAIAIAKALEHNDNLEEIRLGNNQIGDEGAIELAKRLSCNETLQKIVLGKKIINIDHNPISETVVIELIKLEQKTPKIFVRLRGLFSK